MSLSLALNTALSGLSVNQRSLATLSQNIANANNAEYSRKIVTQEAIYLQGTGAGVSISDISRKVDEYLQKSVRNQGSISGRSDVLSTYSENLQILLGSPGSQNSIYSDVTNLFNGLQQLSQTPENASLRVGAVNSAEALARSFNSLASGIYAMQYSVDQDIAQSIAVINSDLKEISSLNSTIASNKLLGRSVSELEDRRDTLLNDVSQYIDIQTYEQTNGVVSVFAAGGYSLVDDSVYALSYQGATSADFFSNGNATSAINIYRLDENGNLSGTPNELVSSGVGSGVTTNLTSGRIKGLIELRDQQLPDVIAKLDVLAGVIRDEINEVHNSGVAFPGANSYTGTRAVSGEDYSEWAGGVRIAVLDQNGNPVPSTYSDEESGFRPLFIDFSTLDTGNGAGQPSVQGIINEINRYYGVPQDKVTLGNVNDIRLVLNNDSIPGTNSQLNFDFQLDNFSGQDADFYVRDIQVLNDSGVDITNLTQDVPTVSLASTATYTTTAGSKTVTVATAAAHGFATGDRIYLTPPTVDIDGIPSDNLGGFFIIDNVTATGFTITVPDAAAAGGSHDQANLEARTVYYTSETGTTARSTAAGTVTASIAGHTTAKFYTVKATVSVVDANGNISNSEVTYRIDSLSTNVKNYRYAARSATEDGEIVAPNTTVPALTAKLVDANGVELPIVNGQYTTTSKGFLKLAAGSSNYYIAIDSLDSVENGKPNADPVEAGTGRGFSHFFELNSFFTSNRSTGVLDDAAGSALNMGVSSALTSNANLISLGTLRQSDAPVDPTKPPLYTYARYFGDNSVITRLADISQSTLTFAAAGDLGTSQQTISSYAGQVISTVSSKAQSNKADSTNSRLLLDGFTERSDSLRGVNLDEELANTIIYQNAYAASARIITVANQFFDALMEAVR